MKIKERKFSGGGLSGGAWHWRVRLLAKDEAMPADSVQVPDDTPLSDWQMEV